ncbi:MAG: thioredoxin family protein [Deltaproteobacteria bacterium]|nr:thioredoxin family protein [Deltaproteobacteria bacterium]
MVIRVLGQGCPNCHALTQRIMEVLSELNLAADFEHVTDIKEIARYGVLQSPALLINGKVVARGTVPNKGQLIEWFKKAVG